MNKREVLELKKRFTKNGCSFTKLCGCYVDGEKNILLTLDETFLNLDDSEFYKYLEIAKKTLSGTLHNNLLELDFPDAEERPGGRQQFLMGLRESKLKNPDLLKRFYDLIIESYDYVGNYLILLFHDAYDVITKTTDNLKLDESEEVFEYLLCAICPVELSKPGLGYRADEHRIGARIQDWVVSPPETGFLFPAFTDRSTDIHASLYYTKNALHTHPEFMEQALGCSVKHTASQQKETFKEIIQEACSNEEKEAEEAFFNIQQSLNDMVILHEETNEKDCPPLVITPDVITEVIKDSQVPEEVSAKMRHSFQEVFKEEPPVADHLLDTKAVTLGEQKRKERELVKEVASLKQELDDSKSLKEASNVDIILKVKPEKSQEITAEVIEGQRCIVIPLKEDEQIKINGEPFSF